MILGTVGYLAPEQVRGEAADNRADIFAFGATLYEMLAGRRAFQGASAVETLHAILKDESPDLSESGRHITPALERVVRRCLEKNPHERFQSARDLAFALEAFALPSGSAAPAVQVAPNAVKRRVRWTAAALMCAALLTLAFFAGRLIRPQPSPPSFNRLTFRRGNLSRARLAPDGQTVVYIASWEGKPKELFTTQIGNPAARSLGLTDVELAAVSPGGEVAFLFDRGDHTTLAQMPLVGGAPRELLDNVQSADWSPDGKTLAVIHYVKGRSRIEAPIGLVIYEPAWPVVEVRFSPQGRRLAFAEHTEAGRWSVSVVDLNGAKKVLSDGWRHIQGLAWSPAGDELWFTASQTGTHALYAVDLTGRQRLVARVPGKLGIQDIARDGRVLIEHDFTSPSMMVRLAGAAQEQGLSWFDASTVRAISADGKSVLFNESGEAGGEAGAIYLRPTDGSPAVRLGEGQALSLSPDGKWVAALTLAAPQQLVLLPTGAGEARTLERGAIESYQAGSPAALTWRPDVQEVLFTAREPGRGLRVYRQSLAGGKPEPVLPEGIVNGPLSPDGKWVAAVSAEGCIVVYPLDGGAPRVLPDTAGLIAIEWSNDGGALYLAKLRPLPAKIYRYNLAGGRKELWLEITPPEPDQVTGLLNLVITPDGRTYAYSYGHAISTLYLIDGLK